MKRMYAAASLLLAALLLAFSGEALEAARQALTLFWNAALPALFPFYVCIGLLQSSGLMNAMPAGKHAFASCFLFGALAGYPSGARMCALHDRQGLAALVNLCSPMFLLGTLANGMFGCRALFFPVAVGHYGSALLFALVRRFFRRKHCDKDGITSSLSSERTLSDWISEGMLAMLRIGGCIVFFYVLAAVLRRIGLFRLLAMPLSVLGIPEPAADALWTGMLEFTGGCARLAAAGLPFPSVSALAAFLVSFGGLSVFLQAKLFLPALPAGSYLVQKLILGVLAAGIAYAVSPLFLRGAAETMSDGQIQRIAVNAMSGAGMLLSSCVAMAVAAILSAVIKRLYTKDWGKEKKKEA